MYDQFKDLRIISLKGVSFGFIGGQDHTRFSRQSPRLGHYFKRDLGRPLTRVFIRRINFEIPDSKISKTFVEKQKIIDTNIQCDEAYKIDEIKENCVASFLISRTI